MIEGRVLSIYIAARRGCPMTRVTEAQAEVGKGLAGDRYFDGTGTFSKKNSPSHEVSFIEAEALEALHRESGLELDPSQTRRNILTRGVPLNHLVGRRFTLGEVLLTGMELCEPCGHMEKLAGIKGVRAGLIHRGGLRCQILRGGVIRAGDAIRKDDASADWDSAPAPGSRVSEDGTAVEGRAAPRIGQGKSAPELLSIEAMQFCFVPAGKFVLGTERDPLAWDGESPEQLYEIPCDYWIARFPVSNAQYQQFVSSGAYAEEKWWAEAREAGVWNGGLLEQLGAETADLGPTSFGQPFCLPTHPVVGLTWYECLAFCRWLDVIARRSGRLGEYWCVALPSEVEWEKAARGGLEIPVHGVIGLLEKVGEGKSGGREANPNPRRRYPWGDEPDVNRANYHDTGVGTTSELGAFPDGASPYGVQELSGNVWEWTRSLWAPYPYPASAEEVAARERLCPDELRTLRGGGFNYRAALIRTTVRHCHSPMMRYRHIGLRVAVVPSTYGKDALG